MADLAALPEDALMKLWRGWANTAGPATSKRPPGRSWRTSGGVFPNTYDGIRSLAGVGDYTAGRWPPLPLAFRFRRWMGTSCGW